MRVPLKALRRFGPIGLLSLLLILPAALSAQDGSFVCGANELSRMGSLINNDPARFEDIQQAKAQLEHFTQTWQGNASRGGGEGYVIPVVFHIIHENGPENISDAQVRDGIRAMNEDYNKLNANWPDVQPEFLGIVANIGITFKLARLDPDGNCTNGITRTVSPLTNEGNQDMKNLADWPRNQYLNIWVCANMGGAAGYSMYPSSVASGWGAAADGIVVLSNYVGGIGTSSPSHSHTLSHEAGHWMNLKHCWGDSNTPGLASNCSMDDGVADTPNTEGWTSCNLLGATCGSAKDNVENFMEYSYCSKMFTEGQKTRMLAALNSSMAGRDNLWTDGNLALTGLQSDPVLCVAALHSNIRTVCTGTNVQFTDDSYNGVTSWSWTFPGGVPATSTVEDPEVQYDEPGTYNVGLTVGNGLQSISVSQPQYIVVLPDTGLTLPVYEGFEEVDALPTANWSANDLNDDGAFHVSAASASTGAHSARLSNSASHAGSKDELLCKPVNVTSDAPMTVSFRYAFAQRNSSDNDALRVYTSRNCGDTWSLRKTILGDQLATASPQGGAFVPGPDQWGYAETSPIGGLYDVPNLRIKFVFTSDGGNDVWLDDINLNGAATAGIAEAGDASTGNLLVVPNPARDAASVVTNLATGGDVHLDLLDPLGRVVARVADGQEPAGMHRWDLPVQTLRSGIYLVRLQAGGDVRIARFTKQ